jgi:hypothetical protein
MSKSIYDVFALVINFLDENWQPKKVTIDLFEATKTIGQTLAKNFKKLLNSYGLKKKIIVYVTRTFKFVVNYEVLGLEKNFNSTCIGHAFSKIYKYDITK